jgi:hypothetical protein
VLWSEVAVASDWGPGVAVREHFDMAVAVEALGDGVAAYQGERSKGSSGAVTRERHCQDCGPGRRDVKLA